MDGGAQHVALLLARDRGSGWADAAVALTACCGRLCACRLVFSPLVTCKVLRTCLPRRRRRRVEETADRGGGCGRGPQQTRKLGWRGRGEALRHQGLHGAAVRCLCCLMDARANRRALIAERFTMRNCDCTLPERCMPHEATSPRVMLIVLTVRCGRSCAAARCQQGRWHGNRSFWRHDPEDPVQHGEPRPRVKQRRILPRHE